MQLGASQCEGSLWLTVGGTLLLVCDAFFAHSFIQLLRQTKTAYCQSLNYIVALLLLFYTEEQAFWMLVIIMEDILPANFYSPQLKGLRVDGRVFDDVLNERIPKIYQHFVERDVDSVAFISGWWLRLYVDVSRCMDVEVCVYICVCEYECIWCYLCVVSEWKCMNTKNQHNCSGFPIRYHIAHLGFAF